MNYQGFRGLSCLLTSCNKFANCLRYRIISQRAFRGGPGQGGVRRGYLRPVAWIPLGGNTEKLDNYV